MAVLVNPESEETKERAKWEMFPSKWTPEGVSPGNPYKKGNEYGKAGAQFPMMLYKAQRVPGSGKWATSMAPPEFFGFRSDDEWRRACESAERFTASCQKTVNSESERHAAMESGEGWRDTPKEAVAYQEALWKEVGDEAAARAYRDRNMSEGAKREAERFEADNFGHQPEIPRQPVRRGVKKNTKKAPANAA